MFKEGGRERECVREGERGQQRQRVTLSATREQRAVGDGNATEEGEAPRGRKREGRIKKSEAAPHTDASASAVVHDGSPKGSHHRLRAHESPPVLEGIVQAVLHVEFSLLRSTRVIMCTK